MAQMDAASNVILRRRHKFDRAKFIFLATIFALPAINFIVFWLYLNISAIDFAFKIELLDGTTVYSLDNFRAMFEAMRSPHSLFWISLKNTLLYWVTSVVSYMIALIVGYFLFKKLPGYKAYRFFFYMPTLIAPTILAALFKMLVAGTGPLVKIFGMGNVPAFLTDERYAIWTCLFYSFFFGFGANLIVISGAMTQVDASLLDAGKIDGVNMPQEMFRIVLPVIWPTVIATIIGTVSGIFMTSGPILLLTDGNAKTSTVQFWIFRQAYPPEGGTANYYFSAALGLFFALLAIPLTFLSRFLMRVAVPSNDSLEEK